MTTKLLIDRELLERAVKADASRGASSIELVDGWKAMEQIRTILAAPRQPEVSALEIRALEHNGITVSYRLASPHELRNGEPLCRLSDHQRAIAELREQVIKAAEQAVRGAEILAILQAERDTLRQQIDERDATIARLEAGIPRIQEQSHQMRQQRDRLAKILLDLVPGCKWRIMRPRIDAALAEIDNGN